MDLKNNKNTEKIRGSNNCTYQEIYTISITETFSAQCKIKLTILPCYRSCDSVEGMDAAEANHPSRRAAVFGRPHTGLEQGELGRYPQQAFKFTNISP